MHAKKIILILLCLTLTLPAFAKKNDTPFGSQYEDTSMAFRVAVGGQAHGLAIFPGVEYIIAKTEFAEGNMPVDIGVLAEGYIGIGTEMQFGAGVFATGHFGFRGLDVEIFENLDLFLGVGIGFVTGYAFPVTFAGVSGLSYFFNPGMSAFVEYNYLAASSGSLGIQFHF